jgi:hypothetical protein
MAIEQEEREPWRDNYQNALAALRMIRETIETLGPPGVLPSKEAVLMLYGPEPTHEGQAIGDALRKLLRARRLKCKPFAVGDFAALHDRLVNRGAALLMGPLVSLEPYRRRTHRRAPASQSAFRQPSLNDLPAGERSR